MGFFVTVIVNCNLRVILKHFWEEAASLKGFVKFREIRIIEDLMKF